ncbi:hypothetical protein TNIN_251661 [Trichonephila inaurata madagascariensis]|uniref:Uncharacterized protein n=1 Tax=Trichonephila inaurata madagascariensis TaxID=2747483 RepID=A0A8X6YT11_9ARAC|nr:hypothetical protein TNIN_251661 [Trichonephila inaurata madagascariensis]
MVRVGPRGPLRHGRGNDLMLAFSRVFGFNLDTWNKRTSRLPKKVFFFIHFLQPPGEAILYANFVIEGTYKSTERRKENRDPLFFCPAIFLCKRKTTYNTKGKEKSETNELRRPEDPVTVGIWIEPSRFSNQESAIYGREPLVANRISNNGSPNVLSVSEMEETEAGTNYSTTNSRGIRDLPTSDSKS